MEELRSISMMTVTVWTMFWSETTIFQTYSCRRKAAQSDGGDGCTGNICKSIVPTGTMNCFCLESCGHILPIWMSRHRTVWIVSLPR